MKKRGSTSDFTIDRDRELHESFMHILRTERDIPLRRMFAMAAKRPSSRFWVSEPRAAIVVSHMREGRQLPAMLPKRREMFEEIRRRAESIMAKDPSLCLTHAVNEAIYTEAPEFYLTDESARSIIYRIRRRKSKS